MFELFSELQQLPRDQALTLLGIVAVFLLAFGVLARLLLGRWRRERARRYKVTIQVGRRAMAFEGKDLTAAKLAEMHDRFLAAKPSPAQPLQNQSGSVAIDLILLMVPGAIAVMFAGLAIGLMWVKRDVQDYHAPKEVWLIISTVVSYYGGIAGGKHLGAPRSVDMDHTKPHKAH
jgi:hypothetical protein